MDGADRIGWEDTVRLIRKYLKGRVSRDFGEKHSTLPHMIRLKQFREDIHAKMSVRIEFDYSDSDTVSA